MPRRWSRRWTRSGHGGGGGGGFDVGGGHGHGVGGKSLISPYSSELFVSLYLTVSLMKCYLVMEVNCENPQWEIFTFGKY